MKSNILKTLFLALAAVAASSCQEREWTYDNKVFISGDQVTSTVLKPSLTSLDFSITASVARPVDKTVEVTFASDPSLVEVYNAIYHDDAILLPDANWSMASAASRIAEGTVESSPVDLHFSGLGDLSLEKGYVLPVTIASSGIEVLSSAKTVYYVFRGGSLINVVADLEKSNYIEFPSFKEGAASADPFRNLTDFTLEAMINVRQFLPGIQTVMGMEGKLLIRISDNGLEPNQLQVVTPAGNLPQAGDATSVCALTPGKWTHIAVTGNSQTGELTVYFDGVVAASKVMGNWGTIDLVTPGKSAKGDQYFHIGYSYESGREMDGMICECRVWNKVRTQEEISTCQYEVDPETDGLIGYWKFDEGQGSTITDYTTYGNNGTAHDPNLLWVSVSIPEIGK